MQRQRLTIHLDQDVDDALALVKAKTRLTKREFINDALRKALSLQDGEDELTLDERRLMDATLELHRAYKDRNEADFLPGLIKTLKGLLKRPQR